MLIDPMAIDPTGRTTLDGWQPDKEGRLLAYQLSEGGDEESVLRVMDVETGELVDGPIDRCRYSRVAWLPGGKAFYYTRRLPPRRGARPGRAVPPPGLPAPGRHAGRRGRADLRRRDGTRPLLLGVPVSRDGRWLTISASRGTAPRNDLWIADLTGSDPACTRPARDPGAGSTPRPASGSGGTAGCTCSPTRTRPGPARGRRPGRPRPRRAWRDLIGPRSRGGPGRVRRS